MVKFPFKEVKKRALELKPAREVARKLCEDNPGITGGTLVVVLKRRGFDVKSATAHTWVGRAKGAAKRLALKSHVASVNVPGLTSKAEPGAEAGETTRRGYGVKAIETLEEESIPTGKKVGPAVFAKVPMPEQIRIAWDDIIRAVPDYQELCLMTTEGFVFTIERLKKVLAEVERQRDEWKEKCEGMVEDRIKLMRDYNTLISQMKSRGHLTVEQLNVLLQPLEL